MSYSNFLDSPFLRAYVSSSVADMPAVHRFSERFPQVPLIRVKEKQEIDPVHMNSKTVFLSEPQGDPVTRCPGSRGHLCCNYITVDQYVGCTLGCSYCIMKHYLNFEPITVMVDPRPGIARIRELAALNDDRVLRIGTGEVGDSLQYDPIFRLSEDYIQAIHDLENVYFELKTKTDRVDHLLDIPEKGKTVLGFSLNPPSVVQREEPDAADLYARLAAARRGAAAGYLVSFHFDPIIRYQGWEEDYAQVVSALGEFDSKKIAWISLGTFRYPPGLKDKMDGVSYLYDEFVRCRDGKFRYIQKVRIGMYRFMVEQLRLKVNAPIYLCMESDEVWRRVFSDLPDNLLELRSVFVPPCGRL